jgi:hypothetical protein
MVRLDSEKHVEFALTSPFGGGRCVPHAMHTSHLQHYCDFSARISHEPVLLLHSQSNHHRTFSSLYSSPDSVSFFPLFFSSLVSLLSHFASQPTHARPYRPINNYQTNHRSNPHVQPPHQSHILYFAIRPGRVKRKSDKNNKGGDAGDDEEDM